MKIQMKRRDIWFGLRGKAVWCPIARALNRATGDSWAVHNGYAVKLFERPIKAYPLPFSAAAFVVAFDLGRPVKPLSFEFDATVIGTEDHSA